MAYLILFATIALFISEFGVRKVARKRAAATLAYLKSKHGDRDVVQAMSGDPSDKNFKAFLQSPETFDDATVAGLKNRTTKASKWAMVPFLVLIGFLAAVTFLSNILALLK